MVRINSHGSSRATPSLTYILLTLLVFPSSHAEGITVKPWSHDANPYHGGLVSNAKHLLRGALPWPVPPDLAIFQSSFGHGPDVKLPQPAISSTNGFVDALINAYAGHQHLVIRPDDVWFAILTQFSLYVNAHPEELRSQFVDFPREKGKEEIRIDYSPFNYLDFDYAAFARDVASVLDTRIVDPEFGKWLLPDFTTTGPNDRVVASVIMMGTLQQYFEYTVGITCGFTSVELLGERSDYEEILRRIDKLDEYGEEPTKFASLLRPVVGRFIKSFDDPEGDDVVWFWRTVFDSNDSMCGMTWYTGWVTAFCFWDEDGNSLYNDKIGNGEEYGDPEQLETRRLVLDGKRYHGIESNDLPPAWVKVPIKLEQPGGSIKADMFAGIMGVALSTKKNESSPLYGAIQGETLLGELPQDMGVVGLNDDNNSTAEFGRNSSPGDDENSQERQQLDTMSPLASWWVTEEMAPRAEDYKKQLKKESEERFKERHPELYAEIIEDDEESDWW